MSLKKIVFATNNIHKLEEVKAILNPYFEVLGLHEIGCVEEIPETGITLEENAAIKARYVKQHFGYDCFSDDTGLEVETLNNAPGVYSARYAGEEKSAQKNLQKLLRELKNESNRKARFRTVICLISDNEELLFEGIVEGEIIKEPRGNAGFGYDPIFVPASYTQTFAQMSLETKNKISHRALAVQKLYDCLTNKQ